MKYICTVCSWEYDESAGCPEGGIVPGTPWNAQENIRSLKSLLLFGVRGMAAYAYHAMVLGLYR